MLHVTLPIALVAVFLWIGFVCAISFMEAWIKFRAPGITIPLGLGIGRMVFNALNKVEWGFALVIFLNIFWVGSSFLSWQNAFLIAPVALLLLQSLWLLPALDARAEMHIQGETVPPSNLHFYYVGMELIKVASLFTFGITLFKVIL